MPQVVRIKSGYKNVVLPDGRSYDEGDTVTLSDEHFAKISDAIQANAIEVLGTAPISGLPVEEWLDPTKTATVTMTLSVVDPQDAPSATKRVLTLAPTGVTGNANLFDQVSPVVYAMDATERPASIDDLPDADDDTWEAIDIVGPLVVLSSDEEPYTSEAATVITSGKVLRYISSYDGVPAGLYVYLDGDMVLDDIGGDTDDVGETSLWDADTDEWVFPSYDLVVIGATENVVPVLIKGDEDETEAIPRALPNVFGMDDGADPFVLNTEVLHATITRTDTEENGLVTFHAADGGGFNLTQGQTIVFDSQGRGFGALGPTFASIDCATGGTANVVVIYDLV